MTDGWIFFIGKEYLAVLSTGSRPPRCMFASAYMASIVGQPRTPEALKPTHVSA